MPYAVEVFLDRLSEHRIRSAWLQLAELSGSSYLIDVGAIPHIAVGVVDGEEDLVYQGWQKFALRLPRSETIQHSKIGSFSGGVCFAAFEQRGVLDELNRRFHATFASRNLQISHYYLRPNWVPHCTLAQEVAPAKLALVQRKAESINLPEAWKIESVALVKFAPTKVLESKALLS